MIDVLMLLLAGVVLAPVLVRRWPRVGPRLLALLPLVGFLHLARLVVEHPEGLIRRLDWVPGLGVELGLRLDGLSWLMAALVLGIGTLVVAYAAEYLRGEARQPRFMATLLAFMLAMLGLVLADDVILLFVFWELTSITSFLLIGYDHEDRKSRDAAFQGLFITVAGGLALLVGLIVLGEAAGSYRLSDWLTQGAALAAHPQAGLAFVFIALGCLTKSAQFPFHFWLPNAMAAPTPVSAYLHSATMVKAGVFLFARLHPVLGEHPWWDALIPIGAFTALFAAWMAFRADGLKRILAYTTVMALGTLTLLLGLGQPQAAVAFLLAHALYKGALFLIAGILTHETGAKNVSEVSGQRRALPLTFAAALLAAASGAGLMPWFGFIAKELLLEATVHGAPLLAGMVILTAALVAAMLFTVALRPFLGTPRAPRPQAQVHEAGPWLLAGPLVLALLGTLFGLLPGLAESGLLRAAAISVGDAAPKSLALWHGVNAAFLASLASLGLGVLLWTLWPRFRVRLGSPAWDRWGPEAGYDALLRLLQRLSTRSTSTLQSGLLRRYVAITLLSTVVLLVLTLVFRFDGTLALPVFAAPPLVPAALAAGILLMAVLALQGDNALRAALLLGAVGFGIALIYLWLSAPDLAITQVLIETLTTILLVLILFRLPPMRKLSSFPQRAVDLVLATAVGTTITVVMWQLLAAAPPEAISEWLVANSVDGGHGRNVVNVILVDFRALDTLGEIYVLALAAVGVFALLKGRPHPHGEDT